MNQLKKLYFVFIQISFVMYAKLSLIKSFIQVCILRNQTRFVNSLNYFRVVKNGTMRSEVALIAIYPENSSIYAKSMINLLNGLVRAKVTPVIISNGPIPGSLLEILEKYDAFIVSRKNRGRDFGAYKYGILWLQTNFGLNFKSLYLINDTLFWHSDSTDILRSLQNKTWGGLFLNLARETHMNSFFMKFEFDILQDFHFVEFWKKYLPSQFKRHAIHKGEILLSTTLIKAGYMPEVLVSSEFVFSRISTLNKNLTNVLSSIPPVSLHPSSDHFFPEAVNTEVVSDFRIRRATLSRFCGARLYRDTPHALGLHLAVLAYFPIKRDLYKYYSLSEIQNVLNEIDTDFAKDVVADFEHVMTKRMLATRRQRVLKLLGEA